MSFFLSPWNTAKLSCFVYNEIPSIFPSQFYHILGAESRRPVAKYNEFLEYIDDKQHPDEGAASQNVRQATPRTMSAEMESDELLTLTTFY